MHTFGFNVWTYFSSACFKGYGDEEGAFYQVYRDIFERIKTQERKAFNNLQDEIGEPRKLEGFGDSSTSIDKVLRFYEDWNNFTTYKSFVWTEEWDTKEAPNRYVRREMEKENKKERQKEKKHYLKTIKDLVEYLRKRDPRYKVYTEELRMQELKKEEERKKQMQIMKIEKEEQKIIKKQMEEQRMKQIEEYYRNNKQSSSEDEVEDDQPQSEYYCELCEKGFKTTNQMQNHKNSKQHKQNMKAVFKEVALDEDKAALINELEVGNGNQSPDRPGKKKKRNRKRNKQANAEGESDNEEEVEKEEGLPKKEIEERKPVEVAKPADEAGDNKAKKKKRKKKDELVLSEKDQE